MLARGISLVRWTLLDFVCCNVSRVKLSLASVLALASVACQPSATGSSAVSPVPARERSSPVVGAQMAARSSADATVVDASADVVEAESSSDASVDTASRRASSIASQIIEGFDRAISRATLRTAIVAGQRGPQRVVRSTRGDVAPVADAEEPGVITVTESPGNGWADGLILARVVAGYWRGMCGHDFGWIALYDPRTDRVIAYRPIEGVGCSQEQQHEFVSAVGERVLLARHRTSGEDSASDEHTSFWILAEDRWLPAGRVRSGRGVAVFGPSNEIQATFVGRGDAIVMRQQFLRDGEVRREGETVLRLRRGRFAP